MSRVQSSPSIRPLLFLLTRIIFNGVKRALTSGRRLIGLVFAVGYYLWFLMRGSGGTKGLPLRFTHMMNFPLMSTVDAICFSAFGAVSLMLMGSLMNQRGSFRPPDVDVLFATPVNPRVVLVFRIVREYLMSVFYPLFLGVFGGRSLFIGIQTFFRSFPEQGAIVGRTAAIAWPLMILAWISLGFGVSIFVNRSDLQSDRNKKIIGWSIGTAVAVLIAYVAISLKLDPTWDRYVEVVSNPLIRILIAPATAASAMVIGPLSNSYLMLFAGLIGLVLLTVLGFAMSMSQVEFLYDQAAARGFGSSEMRSLQKSGDYYSMRAENARQGKMRIGRVTRWVGRWKMQGPLALMWKETILQMRGATFQISFFAMMAAFLSWVPIWVVHPSSTIDRIGHIYLILQGVSAFFIGFGGSQMAFIEMLKRVDLNKPLPFSSTAITFWETAARVTPSIFISLICTVGTCLIRPELALYAFAGLIMMPSATLVINSMSLLTTVLFPDYDDPSQRGFRGLVQILGIAIAMLPGLGIALALIVAQLSPVVISVPYAAVNIGISIVLCQVAGGLYANFNPSE